MAHCGALECRRHAASGRVVGEEPLAGAFDTLTERDEMFPAERMQAGHVKQLARSVQIRRQG